MKTIISIVLVLCASALGVFYWSLQHQPHQRAQIPVYPVTGQPTATTESTSFPASFNSNEFEAALAATDARLAKDPADTQALLDKALTLAQMGSLQFKERTLGDQALLLVDQVLRGDPSNVQALALKGYVYEIEQAYTDAHKYYDLALAIDPTNADTLAHKGHAYLLQGDVNTAENYFARSLRNKSNNLLSLCGMAKLNAGRSKYDLAKGQFLYVCDHSTNHRETAEACYSAALLSPVATASALDDADRLLQISIRTDPTYANAYVERAKRSFLKAARMADPHQQQLSIGGSFKDLRRALNINSNLSIAHLQLARQLYAINGNRVEDVNKIIKYLPDIIDRDITLDKTEKEVMRQVTKSLINNL